MLEAGRHFRASSAILYYVPFPSILGHLVISSKICLSFLFRGGWSTLHVFHFTSSVYVGILVTFIMYVILNKLGTSN